MLRKPKDNKGYIYTIARKVSWRFNIEIKPDNTRYRKLMVKSGRQENIRKPGYTYMDYGKKAP